MKSIFCSIFFFLCQDSSQAVTALKADQVISGLNSPIGLQFEPGNSSRFYVIEQVGRIVQIENGIKTIFFDYESEITSGGEMGLLGLAFHPKYAENNRFFVNYTSKREGKLKTYVSEFKAGSLEEKVLLKFNQPYQNHNGGHIAFGKDGYLYIASGDGGDGGDPHGNGQNKSTLLGKILRIDINSGNTYSIPSDNPFQGANEAKEIYAYGLRNPWRFSFDKETGALFAGDVGQEKWEEVDIIVKGGNYGWNTAEGKHCFRPAVNCEMKGLTPPIWEYSHSQGVSITGGFVYRGNAIPSLKGTYVYGDYGSGKIWGIQYDQSASKFISNDLLLSSRFAISSFGEDADGELYVLDYNGKVFQLKAAL